MQIDPGELRLSMCLCPWVTPEPGLPRTAGSPCITVETDGRAGGTGDTTEDDSQCVWGRGRLFLGLAAGNTAAVWPEPSVSAAVEED